MNFAMIVDSVNGVKSYYIKNNKGYDWKEISTSTF